LSRGEKLLKNRNRLLQKFGRGAARKKEFEFWDENLIEVSEKITTARAELLEKLHPKIVENFAELSPRGAELKIFFRPSAENLREKLRGNFERDVATGATNCGFHRDDFEIFFQNRSLNLASRGENRRAILAMKFAETEFLREKIGENPVLLLDDVFGELDEFCRARLLSPNFAGQILATATEVPDGNLSDFAVLEISAKNFDTTKPTDF
jgi:DNA replication and repair protein RecF